MKCVAAILSAKTCHAQVLIKKHVRFHLWVRDPPSVASTVNCLQPGTQGYLLSSSTGIHMAKQPVAGAATLGLFISHKTAATRA